MRISTAQMYRTGVTGMLEQQAELQKTESRMSSGDRLLSAADDPVAAARIQDLDRQLAALDQYQRNTDTATSSLQLEDSALESFEDALQSIRELTVRGLNDTQDSQDRQAIAVEIRQYLDTLLQSANMQNANGEYLFSGNRVDSAPFSETAAGGVEYQGDQAQRRIQISDTALIAVADAGSDLFTGIAVSSGGSASVFDIVNDVIDGLDSNDPDAASLEDIDAALDRVLAARADVGARLQRLDDQSAANSASGLVIEETRSALADLDYTEASVRFARQSTALEAAQTAFVKLQSLSLFDYL